MMKQSTKQDLVRWMIRRDLPEVSLIEQQSCDYPWTEEEILRCLRDDSCIAMVAERDEKVVGFMVYGLRKSFLEILKIAVHPFCRRHGVGTQMVGCLKRKLSPYRRRHLDVSVRETNLGGHLFFRAMGFRAVRVVRGAFGDSGEDAYRMRYRVAVEE